MKVTTDACLFGAWCAAEISNRQLGISNALEVGAGTGLLSLMIAQKNQVLVDAVEIDGSAAGQASENVANSPWKERILIHNTDILQYDFRSQYDCIFSNPPFYENEIESGSYQKKIAHHGHGLKLESLFEIIATHLKPEAVFFLLLPYKRIREIERLLKTKQLSLIKKTIVKQSVQHQPFRLMLAGTITKKNVPIEENEISIWNDSRQYTPEFIALLKDYYLYL